MGLEGIGIAIDGLYTIAKWMFFALLLFVPLGVWKLIDLIMLLDISIVIN